MNTIWQRGMLSEVRRLSGFGQYTPDAFFVEIRVCRSTVFLFLYAYKIS
ncbi:hypothetical protein [Spirosoma utsteinense]|nr:hypothetical protein [Spirosoma utsteinense]